jgi:magnesium chelatase subunit H
VNGRVKVKVVYVVLEAQYQSAVTAAVKAINAKNTKVRPCAAWLCLAHHAAC